VVVVVGSDAVVLGPVGAAFADVPLFAAALVEDGVGGRVGAVSEVGAAFAVAFVVVLGGEVGAVVVSMVLLGAALVGAGVGPVVPVGVASRVVVALSPWLLGALPRVALVSPPRPGSGAAGGLWPCVVVVMVVVVVVVAVVVLARGGGSGAGGAGNWVGPGGAAGAGTGGTSRGRSGRGSRPGPFRPTPGRVAPR
jgi:hypothetical protein